jgi:hypothetical protein
MNKNIHGCTTSFSDWITDYVESKDFQKKQEQEQTEPFKKEEYTNEYDRSNHYRKLS